MNCRCGRSVTIWYYIGRGRRLDDPRKHNNNKCIFQITLFLTVCYIFVFISLRIVEVAKRRESVRKQHGALFSLERDRTAVDRRPLRCISVRRPPTPTAPTDTDRCHPEPVELLGARPKSARVTERDLVGPPLRMTRAEKACIIPHFTKNNPVFRRGGVFCAFFSSFFTYFASLNRWLFGRQLYLQARENLLKCTRREFPAVIAQARRRRVRALAEKEKWNRTRTQSRTKT